MSRVASLTLQGRTPETSISRSRPEPESASARTIHMAFKRTLGGALRATLVLAGMTLLLGARAATFKFDCPPSAPREPCALVLEGLIAAGDAAAIDATLAGHNAVDNSFARWLVLNSPGGDVAEAVRIADVVRNRLLWTTNLNIVRYDPRNQAEEEAFGHVCAGTCFLVLMAGGNRALVSNPQSNARIGLHRPYDDKATQKDAEESLRAFARRERVPERLVDEMMSRSSPNAYWLTRKEAADLSGYASWFEEFALAACGWDKPTELDAWTRHQQATGEQKRRIEEALLRHTTEVRICVNEKTRQAQHANPMPSRRR